MAPKQEEATIGGRVRRYAKVGGAVGGLAARLAGARYLGLALDRSQHSAELKQALGGLKGPLMKAAQILATIPDALPAEYAEELRQLQSNAPAMGWPFVRRRMAAELGPHWQDRFAHFEHTAAAAASLGQVHKAWDEAGTLLACKLQYPDMQSTVEADLDQLRIVFSIYRRYDRTIDTTDIHAELSERLREELDYDLEARHVALYATMLAKEPGVHVPRTFPELSTRRLLTMTWLDGAPLLQFIQQHTDQEIRNRLAKHMFRAWYVPFYYYGVIHGDPHLGNYSVRPDATVNLLDFGCIRVFRPHFVQGVIDLYHALERDDRDLAIHAYETWGFRDLSHEMVEALNLWAHYLYGPLMEDRERRIQDHDSGLQGARIIGKVQRELRRLGGVRPPREFVLMDRAAIGLGSVFMHLKAEINWHRMFHDLITGFEADALGRRQAAALGAAGLSVPD
jgi:predicted unusual protein kinase regulating ubiquinone biosynthesis (AarF/ABC1/UbiB family)